MIRMIICSAALAAALPTASMATDPSSDTRLGLLNMRPAISKAYAKSFSLQWAASGGSIYRDMRTSCTGPGQGDRLGAGCRSLLSDEDLGAAGSNASRRPLFPSLTTFAYGIDTKFALGMDLPGIVNVFRPQRRSAPISYSAGSPLQPALQSGR